MRLVTRSTSFSFVVAAAVAGGLGACSGGAQLFDTGQSDFVSAPPGGMGQASQGGDFAAAAGGAASSPSNGASNESAPATSASTPRTVQETDLYRVDGNRLYYLNSYRGLMVFDITNVDQPKYLGRSPIYGSPVDMVVNGGIATVVVGDWYGKLDDGSPFHGSIVRGLDATDPTNIKVLGDAKLGGWVQDDRVVGNVIYAVSQDYGWTYGWGYGAVDGVSSPIGGSNVIVSSVNFANGQVQAVGSQTFSGYGGVFNVTPNAIMVAHPHQPPQGSTAVTTTDLTYLDISDPNGKIVQRGTLNVSGVVESSGADNGRWSLDFADGQTAHIVASAPYTNSGNDGYVLSIGDFSNPDAPALDAALPIAATNWTPTARFDSGRMYLAPDATYDYGSGASGATTPLEVFDLSNPKAPVLAGQTNIEGNMWIMIPSDLATSTDSQRLFTLGNDESTNSSQVALDYLDVSDATAPKLLGTSEFGDGWAYTPALGTFKAFTVDPTQGLVVLPFSGWDASSGAYNNGVQLIEFTPTSVTTAGAAHSHGWVERGIFVTDGSGKKRVVSLSDLALSVVDYTNPQTPAVTAELTLARNVVTAQPATSTIAEISSDWWGNDNTHSDVRILPLSDPEENADESSALDTPVPGVNARVFSNGSLDYVVTDVAQTVPCSTTGSGELPAQGSGPAQCQTWQVEVQVVDLSNGGAKLRGSVMLPRDPYYYGYSWGWYGIDYDDWFSGADVVQVNGTALAFRRWEPNYDASSPWVDGASDLLVVDLSNPDAPGVASMVVTPDRTAWWGNMRMIGDTLYTTHSEWVSYGQDVTYPTVRYYLDRIDLGDIAHPRIETSINVPGVVVGGDGAATNPVLYTIDYGWQGNSWRNDLTTIQLSANRATLKSRTRLDGWTGNVIVRGTTAYVSTEIYPDDYQPNTPNLELHQIDLSNPSAPVDRVASGPNGWGWLIDVEGDRALVTSGWGYDGLDIYKLSASAPPAYDQFVLTRGWGINSLSRQDDTLYLSSGYWGVQAVTLQ